MKRFVFKGVIGIFKAHIFLHGCVSYQACAYHCLSGDRGGYYEWYGNNRSSTWTATDNALFRGENGVKKFIGL